MATAERILVCVGPSPFSAELVRATHKMAEDLGAPWVAASVVPPSATTLPGGSWLDENLRLAESLGAEISRLTGTSVGEGIALYARQRRVTRIVVGKPPRSSLRRLLRRSVVDELIRLSGDTDVFVVSGDKGHTAEPWRPTPATEQGAARYVWAAVAVGVTTALSSLVAQLLGLEAIVMLYMLAIMVVALRLYRGPAFFAAALSVAAFDFFFVPPAFTFAVKDPRHFLTFAVMFAVGLVISSLTVRIRREEAGARAREERTRILYEIGRELGAATNEAAAAEIATRRIGEATGASVALFAARADEEATELGHHGADLDAPRDERLARTIERAVRDALAGDIPADASAVLVLSITISGGARFAFAIVPRAGHPLADAEVGSPGTELEFAL